MSMNNDWGIFIKDYIEMEYIEAFRWKWKYFDNLLVQRDDLEHIKNILSNKTISFKEGG